MARPLVDFSYFPGCSLATSARENNLSLLSFCRRIGFNLITLDDWNCCGSSSVYGLEPELAFHLSARNLSLAPAGRPLLIACPKCLLRLRQAHLKLKHGCRVGEYETMWGRPFDDDLRILSFFELLEADGLQERLNGDNLYNLAGLSFVPYYGCMLNHPPEFRHDKNYYGLMEKILSSLGARPLAWAYNSRCCGTFLTVARPEVASPVVKEIVSEAWHSGADCIVTACAMCQLNLEVRSDLKNALPVFHFSELLALALDPKAEKKWFSRHLVDPQPLLKKYGLIS